MSGQDAIKVVLYSLALGLRRKRKQNTTNIFESETLLCASIGCRAQLSLT